MRIECPRCNQAIRQTDVNAAADVALCARCNEAFALSEIVRTEVAVDLQRPPAGAWFRELPGGFSLGASTRSYKAWFLVPFMAVWSGASLGGIYGGQLRRGQFNLEESLFGIPFLIGTLVIGSQVLMMLFGRNQLTVLANEARLFVGIGHIGWTRRFGWDEVGAASEEASAWQQMSKQVVLTGKTRRAFGGLLSGERRYFFVHALTRMIARRRISEPMGVYRTNPTL